MISEVEKSMASKRLRSHLRFQTVRFMRRICDTQHIIRNNVKDLEAKCEKWYNNHNTVVIIVTRVSHTWNPNVSLALTRAWTTFGREFYSAQQSGNGFHDWICLVYVKQDPKNADTEIHERTGLMINRWYHLKKKACFPLYYIRERDSTIFFFALLHLYNTLSNLKIYRWWVIWRSSGKSSTLWFSSSTFTYLIFRGLGNSWAFTWSLGMESPPLSHVFCRVY